MLTCALLCYLSVQHCELRAQGVAGGTEANVGDTAATTNAKQKDSRIEVLFTTDSAESAEGASKPQNGSPSGVAPLVPSSYESLISYATQPIPTDPDNSGTVLVRPREFQAGGQQVMWSRLAGRPGSGPCVEPGCFEDILEAHRSGIIAEFLYLHPRNVDVPYATPMDGFGSSAVPIGPSSMAGPGYQPGFRLGLNWNLTDESSLSATYWLYQSQSRDSRTLPGGSGFLNADLVHPNTTSVATDFLAAQAAHDIDFDIIDVHYRRTVSEKSYLMYLTVGARYVRLDEDFRASYTQPGSTDVSSDIGFDGVGPRVGLEIERAMDGACYMYMRGGASLMFGSFKANYLQSNVFSGTQAAVGLDDNRMVPITELELGLGWGNTSDTFRFSAGYYVGTWFNTVTTGGFIDSVQDSTLYSIGGVGDTLVFDGLVVRVEARY
jgi:hypothetical protein